jgi:protein-S-isoprenylcysteine O-methyltransferase Ste14
VPSLTRLPDLGQRGGGWVVLQAIILTAIVLAGLGRRDAWGDPAAVVSRVIGVALLVGGGALVIAGMRALGDGLSAMPRPPDDGRLVDGGIYARVRHPIYGGLIVGAIGFGLVMASLAALLLAGVLAAFLGLKSRREEAWLAERYPDYAAYAARTRRFIPGL